MSSPVLDKDLFFKRVSLFFYFWKKSGNEPICDTDSVLILTGNDEVTYSKSLSLQIWLFGYELPDSALVFCSDSVYFLSSQKKCDFLKGVVGEKENIRVELMLRNKSDRDKGNVSKLLGFMRSSGDSCGVLSKDKSGGEFASGVLSAVQSSKLQMVDISQSISALLATKDAVEIELVKKSSECSSTLFTKYLKNTIITIIDQEKKVKHNRISQQIEEALLNSKFNGGLSSDSLEVCYPPIIQSGPNFQLKYSVESDSNPLHFGVIICMLGVRYKNYCSNIIRTLLVDPTETVQKTYEFTSTLMDLAIENLTEGITFGQLYNTVFSDVSKNMPELEVKMVKNLGFVSGIEFRDNNLLITSKSSVKVQTGMVVNLNIGFQDILNPDAVSKQDKTFSVFLGETVIVSPAGDPPNILTASAKRKPNNVTIFVNTEEDEEDEEEKDEPLEDVLGRGHRRAILENKTRSEATTEEKRAEKQTELFTRMTEEAKARLQGISTSRDGKKEVKSNIAYKGVGQMPKEADIKNLRLLLDKKYESLIVPIFGQPVPFHISTIKNASSSIEGDYTYLRINFFHPGATMGKEVAFSDPDATFVKEITFRASNDRKPGSTALPSTNLNTAFRMVKELQKKFKTREAEEKEMADLVEQDNLELIPKGRPVPKLKDLYIRPNIVSKRITGSLEAHINGFRFTSIRGDKVDILYNNIKHAIFQPCDGEMIILVHFHLKNPIMFSKKKHNDIQFYTEVGEISTDLGKMHSMHDRDDIEGEQRERELRNRLKDAFKNFIKRVEEVSKGAVDFDQPFRELGFYGVPSRSTVMLMPTSLCLTNLTEWPPFVVTLDEVEFVYFERVQLSIKSFDMVFIFKDYRRKPVMINAIAATSLDEIKDWLNNCDIVYTEGLQSLNWAKIMKTVLDDPEGFFDQGGWSFLRPDDDEVNEAENSEEEDEYQPSDMSEAASEESESEDAESEDWEAEEDSEGTEDLDSSEESGKDWDELEAEALEHDRGAEMEPAKGKSSSSSSKKRKRDSSSSPDKKRRRRDASSSPDKKKKKKDKKHKSPKKSKHHKSPKKKR